MALEWEKVELTNNTGFPRRYAVASGVTIVKGTALTLTDERTAIATSTQGAPSAGIASMEKDGSDFSTSITAWTDGIFIVSASLGVAVGDPLMLAADRNHVMVASLTASGAQIIGYSLDTEGASAVGPRIKMRLRL